MRQGAITSPLGAAVEIDGLEKTYGATRAVDGLSLRIDRGEIVAILGPNGAGKTTTIEVLEGYRRADAGRVRVLGEDPARAGASWRARRGIVLQSCEDIAELTVAETVHHFARYYPSPADPAAVISRVGLAGKSSARVRSLSGGQRRRVDVALGIIGRPELLFLDEPTTGFDPEARRAFWDLVKDLRNDGTTIVLTTHYMEEAEALADRVAVVAAGRVVAEGSTAELVARAGSSATLRWAEGDHYRELVTEHPTAKVQELAAAYGGEVPMLSITRPSLEDVYLMLVGGRRETAVGR
ncbi:MAG: ABC transporter ATP-binding protein [Acidimicrobiales bacterium]